MNDDDKTFSITLDEDYLTSTGSEYTFNMSDITIGTDTTVTIDTGATGTIYNVLNTFIDPDEVDRMCNEYPALSKVWRNFKSVYDMTLQDYKGKKETGEINEGAPF